MKNGFLFLIVLLISITKLLAEVNAEPLLAKECDLNFSTQKQVDDFAALGCTSVKNLVIAASTSTNDPIRNLNTLATITSVNGNLNLSLGNLENITGLGNITIITGNLTISGAKALNTISVVDFQSLTSIGGFLNISQNPSLGVIFGFFNLKQVASITINNNENLATIRGFSELNSTSQLFIYSCQSLESILGFQNLTTVSIAPNPNGGNYTGWVYIQKNKSLKSLDGFQSLSSVVELRIIDNYSLEDISGFNSLKNVNNISIENDSSLTTISGFKNRLIGEGNIGIRQNPKLNSITGFIDTKIDRLYFTRNNSITDISGFNNIHIANELNISYNNSLKDISGFKNANIKYISVVENNNIEKITGLDSVSFSNLNKIFISKNQSLSSLAGVFTAIDYSKLEDVYIWDNKNLSVCSVPWLCAYLRSGKTANIMGNSTGCSTTASILQGCRALSSKPEIEDAVQFVYPNPVKDILYLKDKTKYYVFDSLGRLLIQNEGTQVRVSDLPEGVYFLKTEGKQKLHKIFKQ